MFERLVFHYPLIGIINMFVSILKTPVTEDCAKDLDLIDMAAGYFAYLEYTTDSKLFFSFIRNLPQWAREAIAAITTSDANEKELVSSTSKPNTWYPNQHSSSNIFGDVWMTVSLDVITC